MCIVCACAFEFINGFHDTANAVATVIYTNSLRPSVAVVWSGLCNFAGVFLGGIGVAMGIVKLLPTQALVDPNVMHNVAMVLALLLSAIIWNIGTWYFGIPASSSHTMIGSIIGVGLAYSYIEGQFGQGVNWTKAQETGYALLLSPLLGFTLTVLLMLLLKAYIKNKKIFAEPEPNKVPPLWIRSILIATCTGVSFAHGSNDGQKGVGLVMLILISIVPAQFALNGNVDMAALKPHVVNIEATIKGIDTAPLAEKDRKKVEKIKTTSADMLVLIDSVTATGGGVPANQRFHLRKDILLLADAQKLVDSGTITLTEGQATALKTDIKALRKNTDYAPLWVTVMIALSLGLGTMIGWKRIVKTIGEKIGKTHLSYAQGASAELVAATTIGLATWGGWPVSTTQVLSSGIAGSMVASGGTKNLQGGTVRNILLAWLLTFPVTMCLSGGLFLLLRAVL